MAVCVHMLGEPMFFQKKKKKANTQLNLEHGYYAEENIDWEQAHSRSQNSALVSNYAKRSFNWLLLHIRDTLLHIPKTFKIKQKTKTMTATNKT